MRGKAAAYLTKHIAQWITPAYAGKSQPYIYKLNHYKDHPRLCGEKCWVLLSTPSDRGSPPPMRGKVSGESLDRFYDGSTLAYAGKSR